MYVYGTVHTCTDKVFSFVKSSHLSTVLDIPVVAYAPCQRVMWKIFIYTNTCSVIRNRCKYRWVFNVMQAYLNCSIETYIITLLVHLLCHDMSYYWWNVIPWQFKWWCWQWTQKQLLEITFCIPANKVQQFKYRRYNVQMKGSLFEKQTSQNVNVIGWCAIKSTVWHLRCNEKL